MFCPKCGNQVPEDAAFCLSCGARLQTENTGAAASQPKNSSEVWAGWAKILMLVLAGLYALGTVIAVFTLLMNVVLLFTYDNKIVALYSVLSAGLILVCKGIMAYMLFLMAQAGEQGRRTETLYMGVAAAAALRIVVSLFLFVVMMIVNKGVGADAGVVSYLPPIIVSLVVAGGMFGILAMALGRCPLFDKTTDELKAMAVELPQVVEEESKRLFGGRGKSGAQSGQNMGAQTAPVSVPAVGGPQSGPGSYAAFRTVKTNRSLLLYILFNIVTCGIYGWFFIHALARDVNTVCDQDGQKTSGLLAYMLLNCVTCGIYSWIWWYKVGNRLYSNAPRYGLMLSENGTSVLLWRLFGALLCGIGPFIALHIVIKNMNVLANAYNMQNSGMRQAEQKA